MKLPDPEDSLASFVYGWPRGEFDFTFEHLRFDLDPETLEKLREELLEFGVFREAGKYRRKADLNETNIPTLQRVYDFILDRIDGIVQPQ